MIIKGVSVSKTEFLMYESVFENSFREKKKREGKHMRNEALLEELTQAFGVAGFEGRCVKSSAGRHSLTPTRSVRTRWAI